MFASDWGNIFEWSLKENKKLWQIIFTWCQIRKIPKDLFYSSSLTWSHTPAFFVSSLVTVHLNWEQAGSLTLQKRQTMSCSSTPKVRRFFPLTQSVNLTHSTRSNVVDTKHWTTLLLPGIVLSWGTSSHLQVSDWLNLS